MTCDNQLNYDSSKYITPDGVPTDIVIFTLTSSKRETGTRSLPKKELKVLLIKRKAWPYEGQWALPGGFSKPTETLLESAKRELQEETNIDGVYIEELGTYSTPGRDPRGWIISVAYFALVNEKYLEKLKAADDATEAQLISVEKALGDLELAFDHKQIINDALARIQQQMLRTNIAREFLPSQFTLAELLQVIKTVVPEFQEEGSNFHRKMTASVARQGILEEVPGAYSNAYSQRRAKLYRFTDYVPVISIYK